MAIANDDNGFALVEILAAFTILSLFLALSFEGLIVSLQASRKAEGMRRALIQAESKIDAIGLTEQALPGFTSGSFQDGAKWTSVVRPLPQRKSDPFHAFWIEVTVSPQASVGHPTPVILRTLKITDGGL